MKHKSASAHVPVPQMKIDPARILEQAFDMKPLPPLDIVSGDMAELGNADGAVIKDIIQHLSQRDFEGAIQKCQAHVDQNPKNPYMLNFCGAIYLQAGKPDQASSFLNRAHQYAPNDLKIVNNMGCVYILKKNYKQAYEFLGRFVSTAPRRAEFFYNIALAAYEYGDFEKAKLFLARAQSCGEIMEATILSALLYKGRDTNENLDHALSILLPWREKRPTSIILQYYLAIVYLLKTDVIGALPFALKVASSDPDDPYYANLFALVTRNTSFNSFQLGLAPTIMGVLKNMSINTTYLHNIFMSQLWTSDLFGAFMNLRDGTSFDETDAEEWLQSFSDANPSMLDFTVTGLSRLLMRDGSVEKIMTSVRRVFLKRAANGTDIGFFEKYKPLCTALAHQGAMNEYLYFITPDEYDEIKTIKDRLGLHRRPKDQLKLFSNPADIFALMTLLCYGPITDYFTDDQARAFEKNSVFGPFVADQVTAPARERALMARIPKITDIHDDVSKKVADMYMENPYPRWIGANYTGDMNYLDLAPQKKNRTQVLVAGCGTGQHALIVALQYKNVHVTAIDLSMRSLAYARRKTEELGVTNIDYAQADILEMGSYPQQFDAIESAGVLHHLADPLKGLDILLGLLKPGGSIMLGLYSEAARQSIVTARAEIAARNIPTTIDCIRAYRHDVFDGAPHHPAHQLLQRGDFYSTSTCRDLIFHVQETRYTLPQIEKILSDRGLVFCGFNLDAVTMAGFTENYPEPGAELRLDLWDKYEKNHPLIFSGMYQFFAKRPLNSNG